jgi:hypothetical protein
MDLLEKKYVIMAFEIFNQMPLWHKFNIVATHLKNQIHSMPICFKDKVQKSNQGQ